MWYWFDKLTNEWTLLENEANEIEQEYQSHLAGNRIGQRVYHCFGNKWSALINFDKMETQCGSGRCLLSHSRNGLCDDHMTYKLKRET